MRRPRRVQYWIKATATDLSRLLLNEAPAPLKVQARNLLKRARGESKAEHAARLAEIAGR